MLAAATSGPVLAALSLHDAHVNWAWVVIFSNGLAGLWSLGAHWIAALRLRALWWFVIAAELTVFVQVGMGVGLVAGQGMHAAQFHMFYVFVAIISVAILYAYRNQLRSRMYLLYGGGGLFIMGLAIRAVLVGTS